MEIVIFGGTGFIGKLMTSYLRKNGCQVTAIGRKEFERENIGEIIEGKNIIINMMGTTIAGIWTENRKRCIAESRILTTRHLIKQVKDCKKPADTFIQASAVGIYDNLHVHDENSKNYANNFLSAVIKEWEQETENLSREKFRVVILRMGIVLHKEGGYMKKLLIPFKFRTGLSMGNESQGFSFIHYEDLNRMLKFIIDNENIYGVINAVAQEFVTMKTLTENLCSMMEPLFKIKIPAFIINAIFGEGALIFNEGQKVLPGRILKEGFEFKYGNISRALKDIIFKNGQKLESL